MVIGVVSLVSWLYRNKILSKIKNVMYWSSNAEIHLSAMRVDNFPTPSSGEFEPKIEYDIFEKIRERHPKKVVNPDYSNNRLQIEVEDIPSKVTVEIEKEVEFQGREANLTGYKLIVKTDSDLRIGYRSVGALGQFEDISHEISTIVSNSYFESQQPHRSIVICQMKNGIPSGVSEIKDEDLDIVGKARDSVLYMTFKNPRNLTEGIRKYFRPT
jgi:hypothetical protein